MDTIDKIKAWMDDKGYKASRLAEMANIGSNRASDIVARRFRVVSIDYLVPIARAMGVSLDWLLDDTQSWPPPKQGERPKNLTPVQERILQVATIMGEDRALRRILELPEDAELPKYERADRSVVGSGGRRVSA